MQDKNLPDFDAEEDSETPDWLKDGHTATETIDAQDLWPPSATTSGSFDLTEVKTTSLGKLLNALPTPALIIDRSLSITFANAACRGVMGSSAGLQSRSFTDFFEPAHSSNPESLITQVFNDRKPRVLETRLKIGRKSLWGRVHFRSIRFGKERGILILVEDLTAERKQLVLEKKHQHELQKAHDQLEKRVRERTAELLVANAQLTEEVAQRARAEQRLVKEKTFSETALDSLPGIFYLCDSHGRLLRWNKNLEKATGYSAEEISRMHVRDFFSGQDRKAIEQGVQHVMRKGEHSGEAEVTSKSGRTIPYLLNGIRITINQQQCFLGTGIDIRDRRRTEKALQESEIRYRTLFDESRDGVFITMPEGTLVEANRSFFEIFGYTREEMIGTDVTRTYVSPLDRVRLLDEIARAGSVKDYPVRLKRADGSEMDCRITATIRRAEDGTMLGYHGTLRDVTAQVEAEKRIREQHSFLNSLLESVTHPFYVVDAIDHSISLANSAAHKVFASGGYTCYAATHGRKEPCNTWDHPCPLNEVKRTGRPVTVEHVHADGKGNIRHVEIHAYPIIGSDGNVSKVIEYTLDVTERKRTEQALRESEERMRRVIEASPIGIGIVQGRKYLYVNPAFSETFGYESAEAIVGLCAEDLFVESDRSLVDTRAKERLRGATASSPLEITGVRQNGDPFEASMWLTAIDFQGKPSLLGFIADISKEKALRSQLVHAQKMEAIGTLAGGIAHDFNNLLTIIQGFSELVLMEKKEEDRDYPDLLKIVRAARNGADLVRRILTFSRRVETKQRPVDLNHEVAEAERLLRRTIPKMIEIVLGLDPTLGKIDGDPGQIEQILLNLAVNAQHAMPEGGTLVIETKNVLLDEDYCRNHIDVSPGPYALLLVKDNGHGMTKDVLDHVFEPFYTTKKQGEGTGLGLAMVFGIVKSHGGAITCRSEPRVGTTFEIYFPVIAMPEMDDLNAEQDLSEKGNETLLLVDDEESIRDLGTRIFSRVGYHVITASNGMEALEIFRSKQDRIAMIILDLIMPAMSGAQCLEKLLQIDPEVKVLIASGFAVDGHTEHRVASGSKGFVSKPFNMSEVLTTIRRILDAGDKETHATASP